MIYTTYKNGGGWGMAYGIVLTTLVGLLKVNQTDGLLRRYTGSRL